MLAFARANGHRPVGLRLGFCVASNWRLSPTPEVQLLPASMMN